MTKSRKPPLPRLVDQVQQILDILYWALNQALDAEGINILHWSIMQRAYLHGRGVKFSEVIKATGQSKDNVRRAAKFLEKSTGTVQVDPDDHRARLFVLNAKGKRRVLRIEEALEDRLLGLLKANMVFSKRVTQFKVHLWNACAYLPPGDLADLNLYRTSDLADDTRSLIRGPKRPRLLVEPDWNEILF